MGAVALSMTCCMKRSRRQGLEEAKFSNDDWCRLLSISHRYECEGARERSIKEINKLGLSVNNVDKIAMAKKFGVEEWLLPACVALVEREHPLTYTEAGKLGLDMTVLVGEAREKYIRQRSGGSRGPTPEPEKFETPYRMKPIEPHKSYRQPVIVLGHATQLVKDILGIKE